MVLERLHRGSTAQSVKLLLILKFFLHRKQELRLKKEVEEQLLRLSGEVLTLRQKPDHESSASRSEDWWTPRSDSRASSMGGTEQPGTPDQQEQGSACKTPLLPDITSWLILRKPENVLRLGCTACRSLQNASRAKLKTGKAGTDRTCLADHRAASAPLKVTI